MAGGTIVWFREDLRLCDNLALTEACARNAPVIPVFIWSPEEEGRWPAGGASKWWLHHSLDSLGRRLGKHRSRLILRRGPVLESLKQLLAETGADYVFWNRLYTPHAIECDSRVKTCLAGEGVQAKSFPGNLLFEPSRISNSQGRPFQVFTPFWKHLGTLDDPPAPVAAPAFRNPGEWPDTLQLEDLELLPRIDWAGGLRETWTPGELHSQELLESFVADGMSTYPDDRNHPNRPGTSRMSPHLHFGEISARTIWHQVKASIQNGTRKSASAAGWSYLRQLAWREFSHHLLYHFPETSEEPLREEFSRFPWKSDKELLHAWQRGETGYPIVDAGMRELWHTGWMHNRVRMIVASFLVKHLLQPWQDGAQWFWDTLVDADLANNTMGWQWTSGCGADAAPYFRVFNPIIQGEKFDSAGVYTRKWIPELKELPNKWLFKPWEAPGDVLEESGVQLGNTYPTPIVDHAEARSRALASYEKIRKKA